MMKTKPPPRGSFDYLLDGNAVHVDPPPPLGRGGPQRIAVQIEIIERRKPPLANMAAFVLLSSILRLGLAIAGLMLIASVAFGADRWQDNRVGGTTYWQNLDSGVRGQERLMPDGSVRSEWQDPQGHVTHCVVQQFGPTISRECR
jgi:hypothetical protein